MKISVVITGRSYHAAAGIPSELTLPDASTVDDALRQIQHYLSDNDALPPSCLIAVGGQHLGTLADHPAAELRDGDELTLIAPVAGG